MTLHEGSSGDAVSDLQEKLKSAGYDPGSVDGHFGPNTERAVVSFQSAAGLTTDGIAGPRTIEALEATLAAWASVAAGSPTLAVFSEALDSSCEWVSFTVYNGGDGDSTASAFFSWITVQPEHSGSAVWTQRDELPAIAAGQQSDSWVRLPDSLDNGNYDIHVGILDADNNWVTQQPHVVPTTVHDRRFGTR